VALFIARDLKFSRLVSFLSSFAWSKIYDLIFRGFLCRGLRSLSIFLNFLNLTDHMPFFKIGLRSESLVFLHLLRIRVVKCGHSLRFAQTCVLGLGGR
jgi:hypothetical protein